MSYIVVDVESDGPIPHKYSMVCFGAVVVEPSLSKTFYGKVKPISELYDPQALAIWPSAVLPGRSMKPLMTQKK